MPHFVIDCSDNVLSLVPAEDLIAAVHQTAEETGLFGKGDIKVRIIPFTRFTTGGSKNDFIHITADIMGGRTTEQKQGLSRKIIAKLKPMYPGIELVSIDIRDINPETYTNLGKL